MKYVLNYNRNIVSLIIAAIAASFLLTACTPTQSEEADTTPPAEPAETVSEAVEEAPETEEPAAFDASKLAGMTPTTEEMRGIYNACLYLTLDGSTYCYEYVTAEVPEWRLTEGELLHTFTSEELQDYPSIGDGWSVYSVAEESDYSRVLVDAGPAVYLYQHSSPEGEAQAALEQARQDGCVIMMNGDAAEGQQTWLDFVAAAENGDEAFVQVAWYSTLDPASCSEEYYAQYKDDYPQLCIYALTYDGSSYTVSWNWKGQEQEANYLYLVCYTGDAPSPSAAYRTFTEYVLINDDTVTREEVQQSMLSSQAGAINHLTLYRDYQ